MSFQTAVFSILTACILRNVNCSKLPFGTIAGNRTLSECINGGLLSRSELDMTTSDMIKKEGYRAEEHVVLTDDGYYLTMHRIPGKQNAPPVLIQHGIVCSSFDWVAAGKGKALAFVLADHGYDVWLGNARGNTYSQCHTKYDTSQVEFWDFSFHEMGIYDLPAQITYITNVTNRKLIYIGHSMGTTASYIMAIERPDIASKVKVIFSLSPIAYIRYAQSPLHRLMEFLYKRNMLTNVLGQKELLPRPPAVDRMIGNLCFGSFIQRKMCVDSLFAFVGFLDTPDNYYYINSHLVLSHMPAGTSTKAVTHFYQVRTSDRFANYDYGPKENIRRYGSKTPPGYDLSKIKLPVALIWSQSDSFAHPIDVKRLSQKLPNRILDYKIKLPLFNHIDFMYNTKAFKYVYTKILTTMKQFR